MRRLTNFTAVLITLVAIAFGIGFAGFVAAAHRQPVGPPRADGIVVLTGGAERIETGLHLLAAGQARLLLVSGVAHGAGLGDMLRRAGLEEGPLDARITLGRTATTTLGNAEETGQWVRANGVQTLIVVTAGFHMPRAMLEIGRELPQVKLYPVPVQPQDIGRLSSLRTLGAEYVKLLAAWFRMSHVIRQPISWVALTPVDNSVSCSRASLPCRARTTLQAA